MAPCVRCDLMSVVVHPLDERRPFERSVVYVSFTVVVTGDEKCCGGVVLG